jgi:hypothetical protein
VSRLSVWGHSAGRPPALDGQNGYPAGRGWPEGRTWQGAPELDFEDACPSLPTGTRTRCPPLRYMPRDHDVSSNEATAGSDEAAQQRDGDRKRRIRHYAEGSFGQSQVACIGSHDRHATAGEPVLECARSSPVEFHGNDPSPMLDQRSGQRTGTCANINDEVAGSDPSVDHHLLGPALIELMPPPACPFLGHGGPSRTSSWPQVTPEGGAIAGAPNAA